MREPLAPGLPTKGRLLVASPMMDDPNFDRSVVLLLEHGPEGSVGLVVNRPTAIEVAGVLPDWERVSASPPVVFVGGPVARDSAVGLAGDLTTVDLTMAPEEAAPGTAEVRIFSGYAGWGPGQLEDELAAGAWIVVEARAGDVLSPSPETLWSDVLRRQRGAVAWLANHPADPSLN